MLPRSPHGIETLDRSTRRVVHRMGAVMLDGANPRLVRACLPNFLMEPEMYYERFGLVIPNVVFPNGAVVVEGMLHQYYGACDTSICLATARLDAVVERVMRKVRR